MRNIVLDERPWWASRVIWGFDEAGAGGTGGTDGGAGTEGEGGEGENEGGDGEQETDADALKALKTALQKERLQRKNLEKKLAAATKASSDSEEDDEEQDDTEKGQAGTKKDAGAKQKAKAPRTDSAASKQLEKLTAAFRTKSLAETVATLAADFHDPQDVMGRIDQRLLNYTQDDDDPSIVVWDEAELKAIIKDLRKEKPHLVKPKDGSQQQRPSGSKFAGGQQQPKKTTVAAKTADWKTRLPAMRGVPSSNNNSSGT